MKRLFCNAHIYTMDPRLPQAAAMLVEDGRVLWTGEAAGEIAADESVDLEGAVVMPGMGDSHMHLMSLGRRLCSLDVSRASDWAQMQRMVARYLRENQLAPGEWIDAAGFNEDRFSPALLPTRRELDRVAPNHPMILRRVCGHMAICNTAALRAVGITADTPQPPQGEFEIEDGFPNGRFKEYGITFLDSLRPAPDIACLKRWLRAGMQHAAASGLTFVASEDLETAPGCSWEMVLQAYDELRAEGMPLRVNQQCLLSTPQQLQRFLDAGYRAGQGDDWFTIGPLKLLADGSLGARTALLEQDYADAPGEQGMGLYTTEQLAELIGMAHRYGMHAAVHAIGNGAIRRVLDAIEQAMQQPGPAPSLPHGIVHCQITDAALLERIRRMGVQVYAQPVFLEYDLHMADQRVGRRLASTSYAWRTLCEQGTLVSGGSDCPVEPCSPFKGIYCAVSRRDFSGQPQNGWNPQQALSRTQAAALFTTSAAAAMGLEHCGQLRPGNYADFLVLRQDPFTAACEELVDLRPAQVWVGGECRIETQKN